MTTKLSHTEKINTVKVTSSNVISKFGDILLTTSTLSSYQVLLMAVYGFLYIRVVKYLLV